jgi:hypothetical protein
MTNALDGWILQSRRGASYYGILPKPKLEALVTDLGFDVEESWVHDKAAFVLAKSRDT